ncbi:MAG: redox-sensing transcriptional repressor Rex [Gemmatimonadaceae bacterium]
MNEFTSIDLHVKRIAESTVRRLSVYLRFLEESGQRGLLTISSEELARRGGTTSAQVRKDLSFFGSFGKRGLGYSVPELTASLRDILGLRRTWNVIIVGAGKIGTALAQYRGFRQRGFIVTAVYDRDPRKVGSQWESLTVRDIASLEGDVEREEPDIAVLAVPAEEAQAAADRLVRAGILAILNFASTQIQVPQDVTVRSVNMAMELEGLSFALSSKDVRNGKDHD